MAADEPRAPAEAAQAGKVLTPAARRALEEAEARRGAAGEENTPVPREIGGPRGEEPTRYGDWERAGRAVDF